MHSRSWWITTLIVAGCGGSPQHPPDASTASDAGADAPVDAAPPKMLLGIDVSAAPGEDYPTAVEKARAQGARFLPIPINWSGLEAGPDDAFDAVTFDAKKWDAVGPFTTDGMLHHGASAGTADHVSARYTLTGTLAASARGVVHAAGDEVTVLVRFGGDLTAGNRCTMATDEFAALVLATDGSTATLAAATCRDGVFQVEAVATAAADARLQVRRTATQLVFERTDLASPSTVAAVDLAALPAAFAGAGRPSLYAKGSPVEIDAWRVRGTAAWDVPSDRFVGNPDLDIPGLYDAILGATEHMPIVITFRTIDTVTTQLPSDLQPASGKVDLSDPALLARLDDVIAFLVGKMPSTTIVGLSLGNEVDVYLGSDAAAWQHATALLHHARTSVKPLLPAGAWLGMTVTQKGLVTMPEARTLESESDVAFVTYYPLAADFTANDPSVVADDVAAVIAASPRPVLFTEAGYPSAGPSSECPTCTGSEAKQATFIDNMFAAADAHPDAMRGFSVSWMTDASDAAVQGWKVYYGVSAPAFLAYLATLGVRDQQGVPKPAWPRIAACATARGL